MFSSSFDKAVSQFENAINQTMQYELIFLTQFKMLFILQLLLLPLIILLVITFIEYKRRLATSQLETIKKFRSKIPDYNKLNPIQRKAQEDIWIREMNPDEVYGKLITASVPRGLRWAGTALIIEVIVKLLL